MKQLMKVLKGGKVQVSQPVGRQRPHSKQYLVEGVPAVGVVYVLLPVLLGDDQFCPLPDWNLCNSLDRGCSWSASAP